MPRPSVVRGRADTGGRRECQSATASSRNPRRSKTPDSGHKFLFNFSERRRRGLAPGNHDEIERRPAVCRTRVLVALSENLTNATLRAVAGHRASHSSRRDNAETVVAQRVRQREQRQRSCCDAAPMLLNGRKLPARSQPRVGAVRQWHCSESDAERGSVAA